MRLYGEPARPEPLRACRGQAGKSCGGRAPTHSTRFAAQERHRRCDPSMNEPDMKTGCPVVRGTHRTSVRDFHSFRMTWITLALAAGVPLELVQRVTGHRTAEVVMKHYFRPGLEDSRAAILKAMPKMLADTGQKSAKEQMREIIEGMTAKTCKRDRARVLELLRRL